MHRYKAASPGPTNPSWMRVAGLAAHFGLMHRACLDAGRSGPVDAFAVVPSLSGRPSPHPVEALVRYLLSGVPVVPLSASAVERGDRDQKRSAVVQVLSRTPCSSAGSAQADDGMFSLEYPEIFAEPYDADHHFLTVSAPDPSGESLDAWHVDVCRWVPDDSEEKGEEEYSSASGEHLLRCVLPSTPSAEGVTELLSRVSAEPGVLKEWAQTTVGSPLEGTTFVVTSCLAG
ncbi:hypothetical protein [Streptomyces chumphonensis]|uniref:hypothetical protein n=1 Tax=Streptomyces chumphonensis TaxID=1214925 RepID=UPI003D73DFA6